MIKFALMIALASIPLPTLALQIPTPAAGDPHVQVANRTPGDQILLVGAVWRPMTIIFDRTEHIQHAPLETESIGPDGKKINAPWQGPPEEKAGGGDSLLSNVLPLWPMRAGRSVAQVTTIADDGTQRVYLFLLIALPQQPDTCNNPDGTQKLDCDDPHITTGLSFPAIAQPKPAAAPTEIAQAHQQVQQVKAEARLKTDIFNGPRFWEYEIQGTTEAFRRLAPDQLSDNTQTTSFRWVGRRHAPSIYIVEHGQERQVTPEVDQDLLVVPEVASHWRLRAGDDRDSVADICRGRFRDGVCPSNDPVGENPWTGTTSPNVLRTTRR